MRDLLGAWKMLCIFTGMLVIGVYTFVNIHQTVYLKLCISLYVSLPHLKEEETSPFLPQHFGFGVGHSEDWTAGPHFLCY